jgi:hypothetical protein
MYEGIRYLYIAVTNDKTQMPEFTDPLTDTSYDPIGDPSGTAVQAVYAIAGISMTLILISIANSNVVPRVQGFLASLTGGSVGEDGMIGSSGGGL